MRIIFFDLETGGFDEHKHAIIQIAALAVEMADLSIVEEFECKINFKPENATHDALSVNCYDADVWKREAVGPFDACKQFSEFLKRFANVEMISKAGKPYHVAQLAAYNAEFDARFLQAWYKRLDQFMPASFRAMCVLQRALWHFQEQLLPPPKSFKLFDVCEALGITLDGAHDAQADNRAQVEVYRHISGLRS